MHAGPHITRQKFAFAVLALLWLVLLSKIGLIQCYKHEFYYEKAISQREKPLTLNASRGRILDRNGFELAVSLISASYGIKPDDIDDIDGSAQILSKVTGLSYASIKNTITTQNNFHWLLRKASPKVIERLDEININGLHKIREFKRYYPLAKVGAQLIGYTDIDGKGIEGCELYLNDELMGHNGLSIVFKDAKGRAVPSLDKPEIEQQDGLDVMLTIDWRIQEIVDEEIDEIVSQRNARWGGAIVLDPATGEVLAMSNVPRFDPNDPASFDPSRFDPGIRRNKLVTDMFEPGSTFKIVTFIEALESGVLKEDDPIDCENGKFSISGHTINDTHKLEVVPAREVFIHSSNIGTVKIGAMIGKQKLYERARILGFGTATGIDLPQESPGQLLSPKKWSKLSLPTISFGQGVAVSPLQLVIAYAACANGGYLIRPHVVKEVIGKDKRSGFTIDVQTIRRAMNPETAAKLEELLCGVVESGTGKAAALPNVRIAGKTGTAQRVKEEKKGYEYGQYISSFIGYVTDRNPKILCLVIIDSPEGVYFGSQVAAPVFKNIINRILNLGNISLPRDVAVASDETPMNGSILPNLKEMNVLEAVSKLQKLGFIASVIGDTTTVVAQFPLPGAKLNSGTDVTLYSNIMTTNEGNRIRVPDLRDKTVREAVQDLVQSNLKVSIVGSGIVRNQKPSPGTLVDHNTVCEIICQKR
ncbi:MAG TPA: penicillin-binding transpeptidase domain-containing protein [Anaerolineae bacterium]|nr:penicillin-binding transpeptidase domain-containing protein [Anaerolineae bacterium]